MDEDRANCGIVLILDLCYCCDSSCEGKYVCFGYLPHQIL